MKNPAIYKGVALTTLALAAAMAAAQVRVAVNGSPVMFDAAQPQMVNGRVLVPLRGVFEKMGATVVWDPANKAVLANSDADHVKLQIGNRDAVVNGQVVSMDVPPMIMGGSTMVPLRFLSQSLGATVDWQPQNDLVAITTGGNSAAQQIYTPDQETAAQRRERRREWRRTHPQAQNNTTIDNTYQANSANAMILPRNTVLPVTLDQRIGSGISQPGDRFTATITGDNGTYLGLPAGTVLDGHVVTATPASGNNPGQLDIRFTDIRMPDGQTYPISGVVNTWNDNDVIRTSNGGYVARQTANNPLNNNTIRDAAIGAGAGFLLGSIEGKSIIGALLGGTVGAIAGAVTNNGAHNVTFDPGTRFAVALGRDVAIDNRDIQ